MKRFALKQKKAARVSKATGAEQHNHCAIITSSPASMSFSQMSSSETAKGIPTSCKEMDDTSVFTLAALNVTDARIEVLKRHIMSVDGVSYEQAEKTFDEIAAVNRKGLLMHTIPYKLGIGASLIAAFASFPLCFHEPTVFYFNHNFVTADIPESKDLETALEVGSWAWNWMEPPLGQISFFLLCLQYARSQIQNIGIRPYTAYIKAKRAKNLAESFPKYDEQLLSAYSKSIDYY
eukprot:CAMPEP_0197440258 /NCGR_PEP_ID=MMETSP1175-20131217/6805_1 /TAXON_ID=1003142 /ORGANISM="Triceratium dubium, Strain CCMP147" /LENGTH=234 /DNA_ID=CAMNT_0042970327 /DNA_START=337 /DNA_END=1041 /DNA_ORIENTATION=-